MPSQDDYLDSLLKGLSPEENDEEESDTASTDDLSSDIDAAFTLTEDEIDRILSVKSQEPGSREPEGDVLDMLDGTGDGDLQEIQDLLGKSDRNESIRTDAGAGDEGNPADRLLADIENAGGDEDAPAETDKKKRRALMKERRRQEKAEKKASKKAAKQKKRKPKSGTPDEDVSFDRDMLDGIVTGAEQFGRGRQAGGSGTLAVEEVDMEEAAGLVPDVEAEFAALDMDEVDALIPDITEKKEGKKQEKQGFIAKALSFLLEEEEEEPENEDIQLSDENQRILDELDGEEGKAQKGNKGNKGKKDKKKGKKKDSKKNIKEKKAKPPKKVKEKKPKKPKEEESPAPGRRLTFKKMLPILLLGITVGAVVFIFVGISSDYINRQAAETAFDEGDYEACYLNLYGKKRSEAEEAMFGKSESILYIKLWQREYEVFAGEGREAEALDSLIQTVNGYKALYEHASRFDATAEIEAVYFDILGILYEKYTLSEAEALEIAAVTSDIEYTRIVTALAEGKSYKQWGRPETPPEEGTQVLPDELPEEAEIGQGGFVDNQ